jgi:CBS domain containing-hemolysin-like protein
MIEVAPDALLWLALLAMFFSCVAATGARSLRDFSRHELHEICTAHDDITTFDEILRGHERVALGLEILSLIGAATAVGTGLFWIDERWHGDGPLRWDAVLLMSLALGIAITFIVIVLPWALVRLFAAPILYRTWHLWKLASWLAAPILGVAHTIDLLGHRITGQPMPELSEESLEEEIRTIVTEGHREGLLEEEAREMIEGVIDLGDVDVVQIMTPRTKMNMIQVDREWDDILNDVIQTGHTRIPVYGKSRDDIVGILYVKDLLRDLAKSPEEPRRQLREIVRKPLFVPESKAVNALLEMFQQVRTHIAIVLDEYGGVSGLVTIEDALEEIVGEIVDEYDPDEEQEIRVVDERTCEALGRAHVEVINETMDLQLPEEDDFDTIGGFVFSELGRVPIVGESVVWNDAVRITVLEATRRRIERVRIERLQPESVESS